MMLADTRADVRHLAYLIRRIEAAGAMPPRRQRPPPVRQPSRPVTLLSYGRWTRPAVMATRQAVQS